MDYEQFKERIEEDLHQALADHGIDANFSQHHVEKLNVSYDALSKSVLKDFGLSESKIYAAVIEKLYIDWIVTPVRQQSNCADRLHKLQTEN